MQRLNRAYDLYSESRNEDGMATCKTCIGFIHRATGDINLALKFGLPGLEQLSKSGKFLIFRLSASNRIGGVYAETGQLDEALRLFQEGLQVNFEPEVRALSARLINGIAGV